MRPSPHVFVEVVNADTNFNFSLPFNNTDNRRWFSSYGVSPDLCCVIWERLDVNTTFPSGTEYKHLMWALYFLKVYGTETQNANYSGGVDEKTFRKWSHLFVEAISYLEGSVVSNLFLFYLS